MRLLPQSLFGRLVWILALGLTIAQLLSVLLREEDREALFYQASTIEMARRITDIVNVLNVLKPEDRANIVSVISTSSVLISQAEPTVQPLSSSGVTQVNDKARDFEDVLAHYLGKGRPMAVVPYRETAKGTVFLLKFALQDGSWISFKTYLPNATDNSLVRVFPKLAVLLVSVMLLSLIAVRWVTRPLRTMALAAEALGQDINRPPLAVRGPQEVRRAAQAFNTMQARLAGYIQERTRILAAVSHDLKTPLTRMRLRVEQLEDDVIKAKFVRDLEDLQAMVAATLDFIHGMGAEERESAQPVDVNALLGSLQGDAEELGREVAIEGRAARPFVAHPHALKRGLANLLDNAVIYGNRATVVVQDGDAQLVIRVQDAGPGIPAAEMDRVFDPFYRLESSRNRTSGGTGLGLSIARNIARAHGGEVTLHNLPGGGLEAVLALPRR